ncbi:hypothetical protein ABZ333_07575, partial [Streptomyces olivaceus]
VDRVELHVAAGNGGHGCASVHREKFKQRHGCAARSGLLLPCPGCTGLSRGRLSRWPGRRRPGRGRRGWWPCRRGC